MRAIETTRQFRNDYRREQSGIHGKRLDRLLTETTALLAANQSLPQRFVDHALTGDWIGHRDCHIRPDLVLIYRKYDDDRLVLVRIGSHSELGL